MLGTLELYKELVLGKTAVEDEPVQYFFPAVFNLAGCQQLIKVLIAWHFSCQQLVSKVLERCCFSALFAAVDMRTASWSERTFASAAPTAHAW